MRVLPAVGGVGEGAAREARHEDRRAQREHPRGPSYGGGGRVARHTRRVPNVGLDAAVTSRNLAAMSLLQTTPTCATDDKWCVPGSTGDRQRVVGPGRRLADRQAAGDPDAWSCSALVRPWFLHRLIDRLVAAPRTGLPSAGAATAREERAPKQQPPTARRPPGAAGRDDGRLLKSIASIVIFAIFGIMALAELG